MLDWMQGWNEPDKTKNSVSCPSHWRTPVKIGKYTVLASGSRHSSSTRKEKEVDPYLLDPKPSFGFYLDGGWLWKLTGIAGVGIGLTNEFSYYNWPFMVIKWPDMGTLEDDDMNNILNYLKDKLEAKESIEIACIGGHGRTGTLLAMLRVKVGGMGAKEAIDSLRKDYCEDAIESSKQIKAIYQVANEVYDEATAPEPAKTWGMVTYFKSVDCENCDHSDWSHERVNERFKDDPEVKSGKRGCAYQKFKDESEWKCECKGFVAPPEKKKEVSKAVVTTKGKHGRDVSRQAEFSELAESQDGSTTTEHDIGDYSMPTQEELDDETKLWKYLCRDFGGDLCVCFHMRADHPAKVGSCNLCSCALWELGWHQGDDSEWSNDTSEIERSHS